MPPTIVATGKSLVQRMLDQPDHLAGWLHGFFPGIGDGLFRVLVCAATLLLTILVRRWLAAFIFWRLRLLANRRGEKRVDERVLSSLVKPFAALFVVVGVFAAFGTLALSPVSARLVDIGARVALTFVLLWAMMAAGAAALDHAERLAKQRDMGIAVFMPLIKRTLGTFFILLSVIIILEAAGAHVGTFLAGLGIGGLAVALAAQDSLANMFGSLVVLLDQPFHSGDAVKIGDDEGTVEDIGLRSTRLRTAGRTLVVIPNKTVASVSIVNYSRMPQRRVDQTLGLTYDTSPEQMWEILEDLRKLLRADAGVHQDLVAVNFLEFDESSLEIQVVYFTRDPDWARHLETRERVNLKIMRAVSARGLSFAFPTQTVIHQNGTPPPGLPLQAPPPAAPSVRNLTAAAASGIVHDVHGNSPPDNR